MQVTRWAFLKAIFWRQWVKVVTGLYAAWGVLDFLDTKVAPHLPLAYLDTWNRYYVLPALSWQVWTIVGLGFLLVVTLEGAYRFVRHQIPQSLALEKPSLESIPHPIISVSATEVKRLSKQVWCVSVDVMNVGTVEVAISTTWETLIGTRWFAPRTSTCRLVPSLVNWLTLADDKITISEETLGLIAEGKARVGMRLTIIYPDRSGTTTYVFEGDSGIDDNELSVCRNEATWSPSR